jgi:hypothetical protein
MTSNEAAKSLPNAKGFGRLLEKRGELVVRSSFLDIVI